MKKVVALRKESVDRNDAIYWATISLTTSLSARRAWIEIKILYLDKRRNCVALRKESVDRNDEGGRAVGIDIGRSPQGERG